MKFVVAYSVWNKVDMLSWLLEGIINNFSPTNTEVLFHFDACTDGSESVIKTLTPYWLEQRGGFKPEQFHLLVSPVEVRELGGHNACMKWFMEHQPADFLIVAQDDQHFNSNPCPYLERLAERYGSRLGVIGGRDSYGPAYTNFVGSMWSESKVQHRLRHGEFVQNPWMNSGPVVYNPTLISAVGYLDPEFCAYYVWDDYGQRATNRGFINGGLGMDLTHAKFGRVKATEWGGDSSARDLARRQALHGY